MTKINDNIKIDGHKIKVKCFKCGGNALKVKTGSNKQFSNLYKCLKCPAVTFYKPINLKSKPIRLKRIKACDFLHHIDFTNKEYLKA